MGIAQSSDIDAPDIDNFMDDDVGSNDIEEALEEQKQNQRASWRNVEDYMEKRRLKRYLSEFYDEDWT